MSNNTDDISKLIKFLKELEFQINYFVEHRYVTFTSSARDEEVLFRLLKNAWKSNRPRFEVLRNHLYEMSDREKLQRVGLTGPELDLKLYFVTESLQELLIEEEEFKKLESPLRMGSISRKFKRVISHWEKYFDFANTILGSLSVAGVPGSDAISEIKDTIEKFIHWWKKA